MPINYIIKNRIWTVLIPLLLASCTKDFLDVVPVDRIPKDQFFNEFLSVSSILTYLPLLF